MIILEMEQGSPEWHEARCSIPTASMMSSIITSTGKPSTSAMTYMYQLLANWKAGKPVEAWEGNKFTEIGHEREPESRMLYELLTGMTVDEVGFCFKDEKRMVGCSPDGLVGDAGLVEFKNPKGSTFMKYVFEDRVPTEYKVQVQAQMWITDREWCDFMFQHPDLGHKIIRAERDEAFITKMSGMVSKFNTDMLAKRKYWETFNA